MTDEGETNASSTLNTHYGDISSQSCLVCEDRKRREMLGEIQVEKILRVAGWILTPFWVLAILFLLIAMIKFGFA